MKSNCCNANILSHGAHIRMCTKCSRSCHVNAQKGSIPIEAILSYPQSVNHCYGRNGSVSYLKPAVRRYRAKCGVDLRGFPKFGDKNVRVTIKLYPPDKRKRDIDNPLKVLLDVLQYCAIIEDDSQIVQLVVEKKPPSPPGYVKLYVEHVEEIHRP